MSSLREREDAVLTYMRAYPETEWWRLADLQGWETFWGTFGSKDGVLIRTPAGHVVYLSHGAIKTALGRLEKRGLVFSEPHPSGRGRRWRLA